MTARDEAIKEAQLTLLRAMLAPVDADVLARLATERGALQKDGTYWSETADRSGVFYEGEKLPDDAKPLYRLVG
jgi:hypothetical protein